MAEFCKQCADDLGFSESDLIDPNLRKGLYVTALCEGCGCIQVNSRGECISADCLVPGHHVPMDKNVTYYTTEENFSFGNKPVVQIEYGEWSHTIPENCIEITTIDEIPCNTGDKVYVCSEGTYNLLQFVSKAYLEGYNKAIEYSICGTPKFIDILSEVEKEDTPDFILGWDYHFNNIT